jgi:hypothetical protein
MLLAPRKRTSPQPARAGIRGLTRALHTACATLVLPGVLGFSSAVAQQPATPAPAGTPGSPPASVTPVGTSQLPFQPLPPPKNLNERLERLRLAAKRAFATAVDRANRGVDATDRPVPPPALAIADRFRDAGSVADTEPLRLQWRFTNNSSTPVRILQVRNSCTCVTVDDPAQTIPPGGEGTVTITFNPDGRMGVEFRELEINTDALAGGRFRVGFLVETRARVMIDPVALNLGEARLGDAPVEGTLTFVGRDPAFDVTSLSFNPPAPEFTLTRGIRDTFKGEDGTEQVRVRYAVAFVPSLPLGKREATLEVKTNDAVRATLAAGVNAESVGDLRFRPGRVRLQGIGAGNAWQRLMRVEHRAGKPFRILGVEAIDTPPAWGVVVDLEELMPDPDAGTEFGYMVRIFGVAPTTDIPIGGTLRIRTDVPHQEVVEYPFTGGSPRGTTPAEGQASPAPNPSSGPAEGARDE